MTNSLNDLWEQNKENIMSEITKIKYFKTICSGCNDIYTINLELCEQSLHCYKCSRKLNIPGIEMQRIEQINALMHELSKDYIIEPDGDGLVISKRNIIKPFAIITEK